METQIYEMNFNGEGLIPLSDEGKTDLKAGTVLHWGGNVGSPARDYVIIKKLKGFENRTVYKCIGLKNEYEPEKEYKPYFHNIEAYMIKLSTDKVSHQQHHFLTDRTIPEGEINILTTEVLRLEEIKREARKKAEIIRENNLIKGKELFKKYIPEKAQGLIIAEQVKNESDLMTDYFSHSVQKTIILGYSLHKRDLFSEMRKFAGRLKETEHLKQASKVDSNEEPKTEENKSYWTPKDEHREKYSMGAGYYLKDGFRDSTGWCIKKAKKWGDDWSEELYISIAKRCIFAELKTEKTTQKPEDNNNSKSNIQGDITFKRNEEKNGLEVYFNKKPSEEIRNKLKSKGFRWGRFNQCWYKKYSDGLEQEIKSVLEVA